MLRLNRSILKYAQYFAVRHPKVIEDVKALEVVLTLDNEEEIKQPVEQPQDSTAQQPAAQPPRRGTSIRTHFATIPAGQQQDRFYVSNNAGKSLASSIISVRQRERPDIELHRPYNSYRPYEMGNLQRVDESV